MTQSRGIPGLFSRSMCARQPGCPRRRRKIRVAERTGPGALLAASRSWRPMSAPSSSWLSPRPGSQRR